MISRFHYITQETENLSHIDLAETVCASGCIDWLQLRIKNKSYDEILYIAKSVKQICLKENVRFIINDHVEIAKKINADGVHLGNNDMPIIEARKVLGNEKIIGGTANTFEKVKCLYEEGVNYIGVGPFQFTNTKKNLSDILGVKGYQNLLQNCKKANIQIPIIAIGGIQVADVDRLMATGIHGIAVAGAINYSDQKESTLMQFKQAIDNAVLQIKKLKSEAVENCR